MEKNWLYYAIDIGIFLVLLFLVGWLIAFIVSIVAGFLLEKFDPLKIK
jgi:hypothetical protein